MAFENHQQKINENMLIRYHSGTIGTHLLHSETVTDHLYPSTHVWSHPVLVSTYQEPSASFGVCRRPSGPIETSSDRAICLLSATLGTHQLHSGTFRDHLYPSTHVWRYLVQVSILQDPSATFGVCRRPSGPIETSLELSVCIW